MPGTFVRLGSVRRGQVREVDRLLVDPVAIGLLARQAVADLVVADDPSGDRVDLEHLAGTEAARAQDVGRVDVDGAHLGGQDQAVVARHVVARGTQAVAVERRAQHAAVREHDRRRAVPGLHEHGLVLIVGTALLAERGVLVPGLGHHERDRAVERPPVHDEELEHVVQDRGVRALAVDDRHHALEVGPQHGRVEPGLAGARIQLTLPRRVLISPVVDEVAVGVGALPGGRGVGRVARVHEGERRLHRGIVEVQVEAAHLGWPRACPCTRWSGWTCCRRRRSCRRGRARRRPRARPRAGSRRDGARSPGRGARRPDDAGTPWQIVGMQARAVEPRSCGSTGTSRQNMSGRPHSAQPRSKTWRAARTPAGSSWGRKSMATP